MENHIYYDRTTPHLLDTKSPLDYFFLEFFGSE